MYYSFNIERKIKISTKINVHHYMYGFYTVMVKNMDFVIKHLMVVFSLQFTLYTIRN